jgi:hypothetical protein
MIQDCIDATLRFAGKAWIELKRTWFLFAIALFMIYPDSHDDWKSVKVTLYTIGLVTFILLVLHTWRKLMFPYIDLGALVKKAKNDSMASAVIVATMLYMFVKVLEVCVSLLK